MSLANPQIFSPKNPNWRTPVRIVDVVRQVAPIGLDPCASQDADSWFAERNWAIEGPYGDPRLNGLKRSWAKNLRPGTLAYINPPYGTRATWTWSLHAAAEAKHGAHIIMLTPARTDTAGFHRDLVPADAHCFWKGRIQFDRPPEIPPDVPVHGAGFPSLFTYWGPTPELFRAAFESHGWVPPKNETHGEG